MCGGRSREERRELQVEPKTGDSLFEEKNCFNRDDPLPAAVLVLLTATISSECPKVLNPVINCHLVPHKPTV